MERIEKKIALKTIGCKLNFAETSTIARDFENRGFKVVDFGETANVYIINTCTVTANADKDCRKVVRQATRKNPNAFIAMVGCFSQLQTEEANSIRGVNAVLGNDEKFNVFEHYRAFINNSTELEYHGHTNKLTEFHASHSAAERTRTFLKIQDGCDYECTYCTIPLARGKSRSANIVNTMQEAQEIAKTKTKEIVLTGINTGDFGKHTNESFFIRDYISNGHLGDIYYARCGWRRRRGIPGMGRWFTQKALSGGGPLIDLGVHMIDISMYMMGSPEPVTVSASTYRKW